MLAVFQSKPGRFAQKHKHIYPQLGQFQAVSLYNSYTPCPTTPKNNHHQNNNLRNASSLLITTQKFKLNQLQKSASLT